MFNLLFALIVATLAEGAQGDRQCLDKSRDVYMTCIKKPLVSGVTPAEKFNACAKQANDAQAQCNKEHGHNKRNKRGK